MPEEMNARQIRRAAWDVIWHFRLATTVLGHALDQWGGVAALVNNTSADVRNERARCMNIIGGLCSRFTRLLNILNGREERYDIDSVAEELIENCDLAMADLLVSRLRQVLEDAARGNEALNKADRGRPNDAN
jgi:hypothetical protein